MPISTPEDSVPLYQGDENHFEHVLECLFIPAVEKAGFKAVRPAAKAAEVIQAVIIQNLEKTDLILCDMSTLNANVFFELGIRTALGKPVCLVKDDATPKVPFDTSIVNYYEYLSALSSWSLAKEIDTLANHIKTTAEHSVGENMLWKYFSLSQRAQFDAPKNGTENQLALLTMQMEGLARKVDTLATKPSITTFGAPPPGELRGIIPSTVETSLFHSELAKAINNRGQVAAFQPIGPRAYRVSAGNITPEFRAELREIASKYKQIIFLNDERTPTS